MSSEQHHHSNNQVEWEPIVKILAKQIKTQGWTSYFEQAVKSARESGVLEMQDIKTLGDYFNFINSLLTWVPQEDFQGKDIYNHLCKMYFLLDQPSIISLQNAVVPQGSEPDQRKWLSEWLIRYANTMGKFLDDPRSLTEKSLATFKSSPNYNMDDYLEPRGGWKTFNEFFARNFKPGYRPIAAIADPNVIVSPADSTFGGQWEIRSDSGITLKNLHWTVDQLLDNSPFAPRFKNGIFMHAFLGPNDYHRQHAPVGGKVLEARVIPGLCYLEVEAVDAPTPDNPLAKTLQLQPIRALGDRRVRVFDAPDTPGYEFSQARGLVILDTPIGLVAVIPVGMAQVSSVVVTAEVGVTLRKGEELSYFQFGGSDIVVLFEARSNVSITAQKDVHYKVGTRIAQAYPEV